MNERTNRRRKSNLVTSGGINFNDFSDNQLTKYRVFICCSRIFTPLLLNFYEASRFVSPHRMDAPDSHNGQRQTNERTDKETRLCRSVRASVRSSLRWSLTRSQMNVKQLILCVSVSSVFVLAPNF